MDTFAQRLYRHYRENPDRVALVFQQAGQPDLPLTYADLLQGAHAWAKALERRGLQPGEVGVLNLRHSRGLAYS